MHIFLTPNIAQQTPQMSNANFYNNNYASPGIQDLNSPYYSKNSGVDLIHQPNLQIYNNAQLMTTSPNYGNGQTPAMNINDKKLRSNSPSSPHNFNSLAGNSPSINPNNIKMYKPIGSLSNLDNKNSSFRNGPEIQITEDIKPKLQNIVSTANLGCELKLRQIALQARNAEYNPKRFAAVIMRIKEPKTTALIFSSGKMVCTGAKSEEDSKKLQENMQRL